MNPIAESIHAAQVLVPCADLAQTLAFVTEQLRFGVDTVWPADAPTTIVVSGHGVSLRLQASDVAASEPIVLYLRCDLASLPTGTPQQLIGPGLRVILIDAHPAVAIPALVPAWVVSRLGDASAWNLGRAGMHYRDLIPGRLGGRFIASHIRIPDGGEVPDYVHFHRVRLQLIYCRAGWVRVVYEDQGPPFVMYAGDCVLQPPGIRHRVLEASPGLEVIEIGCPAVHETHADRNLALPTNRVVPDRVFDGQRFVRHIAAEANWIPWRGDRLEARDCGIAGATSGLADLRVVRAKAADSSAVGDELRIPLTHTGELLFVFVLRGEIILRGTTLGDPVLRESDACSVPAGERCAMYPTPGTEWLEARMPG